MILSKPKNIGNKLSQNLQMRFISFSNWLWRLISPKEPTQTDALMEALEIINKLPLDKTLEVESLSIAAAIYKNLYRVNKNPDYLRRAIAFSKKHIL